MRFRILVGAAIVFAVIAGVSTLSVRGASGMGTCCVENHACCDQGDQACCNNTKNQAGTSLTADQQWTVTTFQDTVRVAGRFVSGPVLIVHDMKKMANGEPCTSFYRFDPAYGPKEELVSFHCIPKRAGKLDSTTFTTVTVEPGVKKLVEYQIAGDEEAHGVPAR